MAAQPPIWIPQRALKVGDRIRVRGKTAKRAGAKELVCVGTYPRRAKRKP